MSDKIKCNMCGKEYTPRGLTRHLKSCPALLMDLGLDSLDKGNINYYTLKIKGYYQSDYFMYISIPTRAKLKDLDQFLRDIWLECCGHLSSFSIDDIDYDMDFEGGSDADLRVIQPYSKVIYDYDFGSTTRLKIEVIEMKTGKYRKELIKILARNNMPEGETINSPRVGVCGYDGPSDIHKNIISWGEFNLETVNISPLYKELVEKANEFIKVRPFEWIPDEYIIAVEEPDTKEIYYCNILGYGELEFGINAFKGNYGASSMMDITRAPLASNLFPNLHYLTLIFADLEILTDIDFTIVETYKPLEIDGMVPIFKSKYRGESYNDLNDNEIKIFILIIEKIIEVAKEFISNSVELINEENEFIKVYKKNDKWLKEYIGFDYGFESADINELDAKRITKKNRKIAKVWEFTSIFLPTLVENQSFPEVLLLMDSDGMILYQKMYDQVGIDSHLNGANFLLESINKIGKIPRKIISDKLFLLDGIEKIADKIQIQIVYSELSEIMQEFKIGLIGDEDGLDFDEDFMLELLDNLPEDLRESILSGELDPNDLSEEKMMELIANMDLDLFD